MIALFLYGFTDVLTFNNLIIRQIVLYLLLPCELLALSQLCRVSIISKLLIYLGTLSVEFYLIHQKVFRIMDSISIHIDVSKIVQILFILFTSLLLAQIVHYVIMYFMRRIKGKVDN